MITNTRTTEADFLRDTFIDNTPLADIDVDRVLTALNDVRVRDAFLRDLMERPDCWLDAGERLWMMRGSGPASRLAPVLTILAILQWQAGHNPLAAIVLGSALDVQPGYSLALLVASCMQHGIDPQVWVQGTLSMSREYMLTYGEQA